MTPPKNPHYPHLFAPLTIRGLTLRNRIVMGSMHTRLDTEPNGAERKARFYGARAEGGAALIITGGYAPNADGRMENDAETLERSDQLHEHRPTVEAIHAGGALACLQILHAGRYAMIDRPVGPSTIASPINKRTIHALMHEEIEQTIADHARCARLACDAGYDAVEIMGSEGYLLAQFLANRTNNRTDEWGGAFENRLRLPIAIVRAVRAAIGEHKLISYRISALDLVEGGLSGAEIAAVAQAVEAAGADLLDTGIGWHEARVPTIGYMVPRGAWRAATAQLKRAVKIPVMATNRINVPALAEELIAQGTADLVSLARPMLADPAFALKASQGRADEINTCVACNQACLDYMFQGKVVTCLVNPRAGYEGQYASGPAATKRRVAVVGAGAAGLSCAVTAAERGHAVTLFEAHDAIGGQLRLAARIPGKEFDETLRYFDRQLARVGVTLRLSTRADADMLAGFDAVVLATGVTPRIPTIEGVGTPNVMRYDELLSGRRQAGNAVAIIGAGGIGFDVAEYLCGHQTAAAGGDIEQFLREWAVDPTSASAGAGGLIKATAATPSRSIVMLQRKASAPGKTLGATTGWAVRASLARHRVSILTGVEYQRIDSQGLHVLHDGAPKTLAVDTIVLCSGQESERALATSLESRGVKAHIIGGAKLAAELDAMRAVREGFETALAL